MLLAMRPVPAQSTSASPTCAAASTLRDLLWVPAVPRSRLISVEFLRTATAGTSPNKRAATIVIATRKRTTTAFNLTGSSGPKPGV